MGMYELKAWGAWAARMQDQGLGWAKDSPMFRERVQSGYRGNEASVTGYGSSDYALIDGLVHELEPKLKMVCIAYYRDCGCVGRRVSVKCGIANTSVQRYLTQVHDFIKKRLDEVHSMGQDHA